MSLLSSIRMASNTLRANQIAMQVVGQNIANANTPGYIREEVNFAARPDAAAWAGCCWAPASTSSRSSSRSTTSSKTASAASVSDRASSETQEEVYTQLEGLLGELSDTDLSTSLNNFFASISEVLNQPESASVRNLVVLQGRNAGRRHQPAGRPRRPAAAATSTTASATRPTTSTS